MAQYLVDRKLALEVAGLLECTREEAAHYVDLVLCAIVKGLHKDGYIMVKGFGRFKLHQYKAYTRPINFVPGIHVRRGNIRIKSYISNVPARNHVRFHPARELRWMIHGGKDTPTEKVNDE